jgi:serine protease AprX
VVVRAARGMTDAVAKTVVAAGGTVRDQLPVIGGFTADVPGAALERLSRAPGVAAVTADGPIRLLGATTAGGPDRAGTTMATATMTTGARAMWSQGITGRGVDVAVIDSGVTPAPGLDSAGKVVTGPDFSKDANGPNAGLDRFGHGTHMAGIIAGRAAGATPATYASDQTNFLGMAPDARIVSIKVADENGSTDLARLLGAIDWVVAHKDDPGLHIRVLNLSFGVVSGDPYVIDPLAYAAEQAWASGIVVVAAAGNAGYIAAAKAGPLTDPAYDPFVIAVGAADTAGTVARSDDTVADFSSTAGPGDRHPDLVAPGRMIQSVLAPGSKIAGQIPGGKTKRFVRGSGTSEAAAMVSGAAALVVSERPTATADQVKAILTGTATPLAGAAASSQGAGELELSASIRMATPDASQQWEPAIGFGTGNAGDAAASGDSGFGTKGDKGSSGTEGAKGKAKNLGRSWSGHSWSGHSWSGHSWSGHSWSGLTWSGDEWAAGSEG